MPETMSDKRLPVTMHHEEETEHYGTFYAIASPDYVVYVSDDNGSEREHDLAVEIKKTVEKFIREHP